MKGTETTGTTRESWTLGSKGRHVIRCSRVVVLLGDPMVPFLNPSQSATSLAVMKLRVAANDTGRTKERVVPAGER